MKWEREKINELSRAVIIGNMVLHLTIHPSLRVSGVFQFVGISTYSLSMKLSIMNRDSFLSFLGKCPVSSGWYKGCSLKANNVPSYLYLRVQYARTGITLKCSVARQQ